MAKKRVMLLIIIFLISLPCISAVGIWSQAMGPTFDFSPNMQKTIAYRMHSTVSVPMDYELYANGDLAGYVQFNPPELKNVPGGAYADFYVILKLPYKIEEPGIHRIGIGVIEARVAGASAGSGTGGRTAVEDSVKIRVLFPEAYLKATLDIPDGNANELIPCTISLENWGEQPINTINAVINIYDANNKTVATLHTDTTSLGRGGYGQLTALLDTAGFEQGEYHGEAIINWDGKEKIVEDPFKIGDLDVVIISYTAEFEQNKISPFDVEVESRWGNMIQNVYAIIDLPNNKKPQTPSTSLSSWSRGILTTYWDTTPLALGEYDANITLNYAGKSKVQPIKVWIVGEVTEATRRPVQILSTSALLLILILILVIFNILWLYLRFRSKEDKGKKKGGKKK